MVASGGRDRGTSLVGKRPRIVRSVCRGLPLPWLDRNRMYVFPSVEAPAGKACGDEEQLPVGCGRRTAQAFQRFGSPSGSIQFRSGCRERPLRLLWLTEEEEELAMSTTGRDEEAPRLASVQENPYIPIDITTPTDGCIGEPFVVGVRIATAPKGEDVEVALDCDNHALFTGGSLPRLLLFEAGGGDYQEVTLVPIAAGTGRMVARTTKPYVSEPYYSNPFSIVPCVEEPAVSTRGRGEERSARPKFEENPYIPIDITTPTIGYLGQPFTVGVQLATAPEEEDVEVVLDCPEEDREIFTGGVLPMQLLYQSGGGDHQEVSLEPVAVGTSRKLAWTTHPYESGAYWSDQFSILPSQNGAAEE